MTKTASVLVVDDDPNNFDVIEALLRQHNYQLNYVMSGQDAIACLDSFRPDLILLDVMMPHMDGIEVCKRIKSQPKWTTVPIIMVTALASKTDLARCLATGADDFISKPIDALELSARVHSMLRLKQRYDNIQSLYHVQTSTINILESTLDNLNGNLASTLAHELNTPLNGILGTVDFLVHSIDALSIAEVKEMLYWVDKSAHRLRHLTKKCRIYLELQLASQVPSAQNAEKSQFAKSSVQMQVIAQAEQTGRRADIVFDLKESEVKLSAQYISIAIQELIDNALKFSSSGTPIYVISHVVEGMLKFSVRDQGRGMTNDQITKIAAFVQFERGTYEQQGTGMGLKIVQKIVEVAEGTFSIQSTYQKETTVTISLPLA